LWWCNKNPKGCYTSKDKVMRRIGTRFAWGSLPMIFHLKCCYWYLSSTWWFLVLKIYMLLHKNRSAQYCKQKKVVCLQSTSNPILYLLLFNGITTKQPLSPFLKHVRKFGTNYSRQPLLVKNYALILCLRMIFLYLRVLARNTCPIFCPLNRRHVVFCS